MNMNLEWIQPLLGILLVLIGLIILILEFYGVFRMKYVLNRMHAAAIGDTLGISISIYGLIILNGFTLTSLKLFLVVIFLWFSSPVSSHLIARLEMETSKNEDQYMELEARLIHREKKEE
ncbi:MAG: monovalent cation/H(+) antiporter subunit G [Eubacteriales bacterium]